MIAIKNTQQREMKIRVE